MTIDDKLYEMEIRLRVLETFMEMTLRYNTELDKLIQIMSARIIELMKDRIKQGGITWN